MIKISLSLISYWLHKCACNVWFVQIFPAGVTFQIFYLTDGNHKRSKSAGQSLDFLQTEAQTPSLATAQFIGEHMTKEDPFYKPSAASINPFESIANLREGKKLLASAYEAEHSVDTSMTLPIVRHGDSSPNKLAYSLPDTPGLVRNVIAQYNSQIVNSREIHSRKLSSTTWAFEDDALSIDSAVDMSGTRSERDQYKFRHSRTTSHSKQLNLECAMLFSGLDLIQMQRTKLPGQDTTSVSDLESEFQDDLEDVLKSCSSSGSWLSLDEIALSPSHSLNEPDYEWWKFVDKSDPASRYFHPTLVEKRRQLKKVECRSKEKIEQLQQKLDQLRLQTKKPRSFSSVTSASTHTDSSYEKLTDPPT